MSVSREEYVYIGTKLPCTVIEKDEDGEYSTMWKAMIDGTDEDLSAVVDGMNGEYVVAGKRIANGSEFAGISITETPIPNTNEVNDIKQKIKEKLGLEVDIKIISFTHWR